MVFNDGDGEGVGIDVHVLVGDIDPVVGRQVTKEVDALIKVVDSVGLVADQVVKAVGGVSVDKAVADPFRCLDPVSYILISASYSLLMKKKTHVSLISAITSNASSTPSSPINSPLSNLASYASLLNEST